MLAQRRAQLGTNLGLGSKRVGRVVSHHDRFHALLHVAQRLRQNSYRAVVMVHNESSTGVAYDIGAVGSLLRDSLTLLVVDSVSGLAGMEMKMDAWGADIVLHVNPPDDAEIALIQDGATLVSLMSPALQPELIDKLAARDITAMAMDAVPRISRAQSLDVLSSMANIAGYRAVIEAANVFGRFFTGQVTAAGKVPPAKVLVAGAGVAGLAAIGAAGSLGAIVRATDPRPEVADQVKSMGGEYLSVEAPDVEVSASGYAKEMGDDYKVREAALYAEQAKDVDIIITTALIPGKPAPKLITAEMVQSMKPGSVIVDMAAEQGGNQRGKHKEAQPQRLRPGFLCHFR